MNDNCVLCGKAIDIEHKGFIVGVGPGGKIYPRWIHTGCDETRELMPPQRYVLGEGRLRVVSTHVYLTDDAETELGRPLDLTWPYRKYYPRVRLVAELLEETTT